MRVYVSVFGTPGIRGHIERTLFPTSKGECGQESKAAMNVYCPELLIKAILTFAMSCFDITKARVIK